MADSSPHRAGDIIGLFLSQTIDVVIELFVRISYLCPCFLMLGVQVGVVEGVWVRSLQS